MRYRGFTDRKPGMLVGVNQNYADTLLAQNGGQHGTGEPIAENGHIKVVFRILHLLTDLLQHGEHDLAEHKQVYRDQFFVEPLYVAADMEPARILTADVLGLAIVNARNNPHVVELPKGG